MHTMNQPQTTINSDDRDAAIQIMGEGGEATKARKTRPNVAREVKALNGTRGRGACFVRVKLDREWNEIRVKLTDGHVSKAEAFIDLGHTAESRAAALDELRGTVKAFAAN